MPCPCRFDPNSTKFTLESVVSLRLDQHCDFIAELSVTASKEQAIETSLANIANTWAELQLDMSEYKATYKLRSTEDIFTALEDNGVTLSTMKASKYYLVFEAQVSHWERTLAVASETVEMILQVGVRLLSTPALHRLFGVPVVYCRPAVPHVCRRLLFPACGVSVLALCCRSAVHRCNATGCTWRTSLSAAKTSASSCRRRA